MSIFGDQSKKNFTPIHIPKIVTGAPKEPGALKTFAYSLGALLFALSLAGATYIIRTPPGTQTIKSEAAPPGGVECKDGSVFVFQGIKNPTYAQVFITSSDGLIEGIVNGDTITKSEATIEWEAIPEAQSYFVLLSTEAGQEGAFIDPTDNGIETNDTRYQAENLLPNTTYYVLVRSKSTTGLGGTFPTPDSCYFMPAPILFEFTTGDIGNEAEI